MIIPIAIAMIAIFIIVVEALLLYDVAPFNRFAIKYSRFKMPILLLKNTFFLTLFILISCGNKNASSIPKEDGDEYAFAKAEKTSLNTEQKSSIIVGANRISLYLPFLDGKKVGIVTNQSGLIFKTEEHHKDQSTHIVDSLLQLQVNIQRVYSPEHGFRGNADAGENVEDGKDSKTGLPIVSLHGKNKKPTQEQLEGIDVLVFDIQDVGVRFYTCLLYTSPSPRDQRGSRMPSSA